MTAELRKCAASRTLSAGSRAMAAHWADLLSPQPPATDSMRYDMAISPFRDGTAAPAFRIYDREHNEETVAMVYDRAVADKLLAVLNAPAEQAVVLG